MSITEANLIVSALLSNSTIINIGVTEESSDYGDLVIETEDKIVNINKDHSDNWVIHTTLK